MTAGKWFYDETKIVGVDYADEAQVRAYDEQMACVRDVDAEGESILDALGCNDRHALLEIGAGTGAFAVAAAARCARVYAVDVSPAMIDFAKKKAERLGVNNIEFHRGGFLTY